MQDINWLLARMENPGLLEKGDESRLRELIAEYPAFAAPYLLLARRLHDMKHSAFDDLLPVISLRAYDRKKLFHLIHDIPSVQHVEPVRPVETSKPDTEEPVVEEEVETEVVLPKSRFAIDFNQVEKEEEPETQETSEIKEIPFGKIREDSASTSAEATADKEVEEEDTIKGHAEPVEAEPVEEEDSAFAEATADKEVEEEDTIKGHAEPVEAEPVEVEDSASAEATVDKEVEEVVEKEKTQERLAEPAEAEPVEAAGDFFAWLNNLSPIETEHIKAAGTENFHELEGVELPENVESEERIEETEEEIDEGGNDETMSLIDKFIETQPSITRVKNEFFNPVNQAKASEQENEDLVTETIARILVKQEKFEKAIQTYEKLQLKYPQKNDYFAALILELKEKIK